MAFHVPGQGSNERSAEKARQGTLTPDEEATINMFERLNNVLGILKSRARQLLKHGSDSSAT